jgi:hypothetical protein
MQPQGPQANPLSDYLSGNTQQGQTEQQAGPVLPAGENTITPTTIDQGSMLGQEEDSDQQQTPFNATAFQAQLAHATGSGSSDTQKVGNALNNTDAGLCQKYVDDQTGAKQRYPTAYATWQAKMKSGEATPGLSGIQPGDVVEFAPDSGNGGDGHAAIVNKNGELSMATYNGIQTIPMDTWIKESGQSPLGYYSPSASTN